MTSSSRSRCLSALGLAFVVGACAAQESVRPTSPAPPAMPAPATTPLGGGPHAPAPPVPPGIDPASIDPAVAPCDSFFGYACDGWVRANPIPPDKSMWCNFFRLDAENQDELRAILEKDAVAPPEDQPYSRALGDLWATCMDEASIEKQGTHPLDALMSMVAGVHDARSLMVAVGRLDLLGANPYLQLGSAPDLHDSTRKVLYVDSDGLSLPDRDYYLNGDAATVATRDHFVDHVQRMFALLGERPAVAKAEAGAVLKAETLIAKAMHSNVERQDPHLKDNYLTHEGLAKLAPHLPWDALFADLGLSAVERINIVEPDYVAAFDSLVAHATGATWRDEIRPYLRWRALQNRGYDLGRGIVDETFSLYKELTGAQLPPRWKRCVEVVEGSMPEAVIVPFVRAKLGEDGKHVAAEMVQAIEASMRDDLQRLPWMDDVTRAGALDKLRKVSNKIGYPDKWRNYDALVINRSSFALNTMRADEFEARRLLAQAGKPVDRSEWLMLPSEVNAEYDPAPNEMSFPAGVLQPPIFSIHSPTAVRFGAIGFTMGHELTHGFDSSGAEYDGAGNLRSWWSSSVHAEFERRAQCLVDQFDSYVVVDALHLNGKLTLGENIADLGGVKIALAATHAALPAASAETDRQFFLSYAQSMCGASRDERARELVKDDAHSAWRWRVDGPLSNMPEFAAAFSCRDGDAMVRPAANRCEVW